MKLSSKTRGKVVARKTRSETPRELEAGTAALHCARRSLAGILLTECMVYIAVFAILTSIGMAAFYLCWEHSNAMVYATDDIDAALRAGEHWRADVRQAGGKISIEQTTNGQLVRIPESGREIDYRFASGQVRREIPAVGRSDLILPKVNTSRMTSELREGVTAWRWELELIQRRKETQLPLLFTFEAVQNAP
jgi:hypothetical protein